MGRAQSEAEKTNGKFGNHFNDRLKKQAPSEYTWTERIKEKHVKHVLKALTPTVLRVITEQEHGKLTRDAIQALETLYFEAEFAKRRRLPSDIVLRNVKHRRLVVLERLLEEIKRANGM